MVCVYIYTIIWLTFPLLTLKLHMYENEIHPKRLEDYLSKPVTSYPWGWGL